MLSPKRQLILAVCLILLFSVAASIQAQTEQPVCSPRGGASLEMSIRNNTTEPIELIWFSSDCQEILYQTIAPNATINQQTFAGHLWGFRKSDGTVVESFAADPENPDRTYAEPNCPGYTASENFNRLIPIVLQQGQVFTMNSAGGVSGAGLQLQGATTDFSVDFDCDPGTKSVIIEQSGTYGLVYTGSGSASREGFTYGSDNGCSVAVTDTASLTAAIEKAQSDTCPGPDSIILTQDVTFTSAAYSGRGQSLALPVINGDITIEGNDHTISRASDPNTPEFGFFVVIAETGETASLILNNVTLTGAAGRAIDISAPGGEASLTITDSTLSNNSTGNRTTGGPAILSGASGGGTVQVDITRTTFTDNSAPNGNGGAINTGTGSDNNNNSRALLTIRDSTFSGNSSPNFGDAIVNYPVYGTAEITVDGTSYNAFACFRDDTGTLEHDEDCQ